MKKNTALGVFALAAALLVPATADAAGPPLPVAGNGNKVKVFATGVPVPVAYAFAGRDTFIAGGAEGPLKGGIYVVRPGSTKAKKVPGTSSNAFGVAWSGGKLYASLGTSLAVFSKWNGRRFKSRKTILKATKKDFTGFNGIAIGPDHRLYAGVTLEFDHKASKKKYANSVISVRKSGKDLKVVSTGLRQPWQMAFAKGQKSPIVTDLGQDKPKGTKAPDLIVKATPGSDFGFPKCNWSNAKTCEKFDLPILILDPQPNSPSPMGIAAKGRKLYVAMFNGLKLTGPEVITTNTKGTVIRDFLTGFAAPVFSTAVHNGYVYAGDFTGTIYRVKG